MTSEKRRPRRRKPDPMLLIIRGISRGESYANGTRTQAGKFQVAKTMLLGDRRSEIRGRSLLGWQDIAHGIGWSISIKAVARCWGPVGRRSVWTWASFRLSYRVLGTCALAEASPKSKNPRRPSPHVFGQCANGFRKFKLAENRREDSTPLG